MLANGSSCVGPSTLFNFLFELILFTNLDNTYGEMESYSKPTALARNISGKYIKDNLVRAIKTLKEKNIFNCLRVVGVMQARQHNLAALPCQLNVIWQWRNVWIGPCLRSLFKWWYEVYLNRIVFFMTV